MLRTIEIEEHRECSLPKNDLSPEQGASLYRDFGNRIDIHFPSPRTRDRWQLTSRGCVGALTIDEHTALVIRPKLPVWNLARMLQVAYDLPVETFAGIARCRTVPELYDQLVRALLNRVRSILNEGLHYRYLYTERELQYVRGRIAIGAQLRQPARLSLLCGFHERTASILENHVLVWTLHRVLRVGLADDALQAAVRATYRELGSRVSLQPVRASDLDSLTYDRQTNRYEGAHRLCRLLLDSAGPIPEDGAARTVPFLLDMPRLFEQFVARWLESNLPAGFSLQAQERSLVGNARQVEFIIDLVMYDENRVPICVLDTKYKLHEAPSADDVAQVGYYALLKGCHHAGLVYPQQVPQQWQGTAGAVSTFRVAFDLEDDVEGAGQEFIAAILARLRATIIAN